MERGETREDLLKERDITAFSIAGPLIVAAICFAISLISAKQKGTLDGLYALESANSYFDISIFSIAFFDLMQQYFFFQPTKIKQSMAVTLMMATVAFLCFYIAYIFCQDNMMFNIFFLVFDVAYLIVLCLSFEKGGKNKKKHRSFSA